MGIRRVQDLTAYQFVLELKLEAYRLLTRSREAREARKWSGQIRDALLDCESDVAEGFARKNPGDFANFLRFALASLAEAKTRLNDGVARAYYTDADVLMSRTWEQRARTALEHLRDTQLQMAEERKKNKRSGTRSTSRRAAGSR